MIAQARSRHWHSSDRFAVQFRWPKMAPLVLLLLVGFLIVWGMAEAFFSGAAAPPVTLPAANSITAVEVRPNASTSGVRPVTINDPETIQRFVSFVNARASGWVKPWGTFPGGTYTVAVKGGDRLVASFWPSSGHIGGRQGNEDAESNRLRSLSNEEWQELEGILGIDGGDAVDPP